ncbi:hypothetical protein HY345_01150 [Candidatus Microgenomates bacterium]|nr:hypothetical protein [Candidatus Microgenomates bacterium]
MDQSSKTPNIVFEKPEKISPPTLERLQKIAVTFAQKLYKRAPIERMEITFNEVKASFRRPISFITSLKVKFFNGANLFSRSEHKSAITSLHQAIAKVAKQYRRKVHKEN